MPTIEGDFPADAANLGAKMVAMQSEQLLAGNKSQPQEERHGGLLQILGPALECFDIRFLDNVGSIDPALQPAVEAQRDHSAQPVAVACQQGTPLLVVAPGGGLEQLIGFGRILGHKHRRKRFRLVTPEQLITFLPWPTP